MKVIVGTFGTSLVPGYAGSNWVRMQYMLGLQRLGLESYWVDRILGWAPHQHRAEIDVFAEQFGHLAARYGFENRYSIVVQNERRHFGLDAAALDAVIDEADLLLNVGGYLPPGDPLHRVKRKAFIDVDPLFMQVWIKQVGLFARYHDFFFTVGQNVDKPGFPVASDIPWRPIRPPVVLDQWPALIDARCTPFTTVATWRNSETAVYEGVTYDNKRSEFLRLIDLPRRSGQGFELALCIGNDVDDLKTLLDHGWGVVDPYQVAGTLELYRNYIRYSRAEIGVAKHGYVASNSGWISDRTACYLASGKPALVQSTGFENTLPTGEGLLTFRTPEEALDGIERINADYTAHCEAARRLAETHFDSDRVLTEILEHVGL